MSFSVAQKTLESLEWPQLMARLRDACRTPQARRLLASAAGAPSDADETPGEAEEVQGGGSSPAAPAGEDALFARDLTEARERQAETSEARALLDADQLPPLGGAAELSALFRRAGKGGVMAGPQLLDVGATLATLRETARFLAARQESAPRLAEQAALLGEERDLASAIEFSIDRSGEVSDKASPALAEARRESSRLASDLQRRLARYLQDEDVAGALSDDFFTVRNDRYVLPVRSDHRGAVKGIVHDASRSGTTLFIEPEAVVDLNNRLKQAELLVAREIERVLRDLTARVAEAAPSIAASLEVLAAIDLAFARGRLSLAMEASEPRIEADGVFELPQLRHPLLDPAEAVPNDLRIGGDFQVLVLSGPNAGGKTVALKSLGLAALSARAGLHVPALAGSRVAWVEAVLAEIGDGQDMGESLSTFSAHMLSLAEIVEAASPHALALLDEIGVGTDPAEGAALAQAVLEGLADGGARVVATTHYNLLKEMAAVDERFENGCVEFDPETLAPTYRLHLGEPGVSSATAVAARMGMPGRVLERAASLLDREDRQLDRMLQELGASRAALETEQREVSALRAESEAIRDEYRVKLERLQERRDKLFLAMREDLDRSFKDAHAQVAAVIRDLQRRGTAQDAAHARERLKGLEAEAQRAEEASGVRDRSEQTAAAGVDWRRAQPGDPVGVPGGATGVLASLPDGKGRVRVKVGSATLVMRAEQLHAATGTAAKAPREPRVRVEAQAPIGGGTLRCDLRGMRVAEALERLGEVIDRGLAEAHDVVEIVHGIGTGALRSAVREELSASPLVADIASGDPNAGGEGVTYAKLRNRA